MIRTSPLAAALGLAVLFAAASAEAQQVNHPANFTGQTDLTLTNNANVTAGGNLQLTSLTPGNQRGSAFTTAAVPINQFVTQFDFHLLGTAGGMADGMGFCIQNIANTAIGNTGGAMGYGGMAGAASMFIKFDCYNNVSTTQIYTAGAAPNDAGSIDLRPLGIDWHTQHNFRCTMTYNGTAISMTLQDLTTMASNTQTFTIDLPTLMGGGTAYVGFVGATGGAFANQEVLNWTYSSLASPTGLVATPGFNSISLTWNPVAGATGYRILRLDPGATAFALVGTTTAPTVTFVDNTVTYPFTYQYVVQTVQGTIQSLNSNPPVTTTPLQPPITVNATTINVVEGGAPVVFNITVNQPLTAGLTINFTVATNVPTEGQVASSGQPLAPAISAQTVNFQIMGPQAAGLAIPVRVYGVDDPFVDGNQAFTVTVSFTSTQANPFSGFTIPVINCTNVDNDTPGVVVSRTAGLVTSEGGGFDSFNVRLTTSPSAPLTLNIASSNLAEGTVSAGTFVFSGANYATGVNVTVTGVDDALLDFAVGYTILLGFQGGGAAEYAGIVPPNVSVVNLDNEVPPALEPVWGSSGCGLLGLEGALPLLLLFLKRRRKLAC